MRIERAENAGFCYGVRRAVEMTTQAARENAGSGRKVMTLGPLIHNEIVVDQLRREGVECVDSPDEVPAGALVIIRSHGVPEAVYEAVRMQGAEVLDATCPFVKKIHEIVRDASDRGEAVVIAGDREHPEVQGIRGW